MPDTQTPAAPADASAPAAGKAPAKPDLTAGEVAKKLQDPVQVVKRDKTGAPLYDRKAGRFETETRKARAEDILAFRRRGDVIRVTTVDGRKHEVPA